MANIAIQLVGLAAVASASTGQSTATTSTCPLGVTPTEDYGPCITTGCCSSPNFECYLLAIGDSGPEYAQCKPPISSSGAPIYAIVPPVGEGICRSLPTNSIQGDRFKGVSYHGNLQATGNKIKDQHGDDIQLRGVSTYHSQWFGVHWNEENVCMLAQNWGVTVVRAAIGVDKLETTERSWYYPEGRVVNQARAEAVIDAAIANDIYVIIDFHSHYAHLPDHTALAKDFFAHFINKYGNIPNIIWETYNEPDFGIDWDTVIKPYHDTMLAHIRGFGNRNLVTLGTDEWSKGVDTAARNPVNDPNVAYSLHFYTGSYPDHAEPLRNKARTALQLGKALFVTEWGFWPCAELTGFWACAGLDAAQERQLWFDFMNEHNISHVAWALLDKKEPPSFLQEGTTLPDQKYTERALWLRANAGFNGPAIHTTVEGKTPSCENSSPALPAPQAMPVCYLLHEGGSKSGDCNTGCTAWVADAWGRDNADTWDSAEKCEGAAGAARRQAHHEWCGGKIPVFKHVAPAP